MKCDLSAVTYHTIEHNKEFLDCFTISCYVAVLYCLTLRVVDHQRRALNSRSRGIRSTLLHARTVQVFRPFIFLFAIFLLDGFAELIDEVASHCGCVGPSDPLCHEKHSFDSHVVIKFSRSKLAGTLLDKRSG